MNLAQSSNQLFKEKIDHSFEPLAYRLAPKSFDDFVGQTHIIGKDKPLRSLIENDKLISLILWGPPGCGKTALSRLISYKTKSSYLFINAVMSKVSDIREAIETAKLAKQSQKRTILFIDEIHRFNKAQQDALLPDVENGTITLIGATTENPFFSVNPGLISRSHVFEFKPLEPVDLKALLDKALKDNSLKKISALDEKIKDYLIAQSQGDARKLLNNIEAIESVCEKRAKIPELEEIKSLVHKEGVSHNIDTHYDLISAYIKSIRGSDPDAAIYWLARLLKGGEDPRFIARRLIILASEDIGNADPMALVLAAASLKAVEFIGLPEAQLNLSQVTTYLATAPKSNASTIAIMKANQSIDEGKIYPVPNYLRDSHYKGAEQMGFGKGYLYPHDFPHGIVKQKYCEGSEEFYKPVERGFERTIKKRMEWIKREMGNEKPHPPAPSPNFEEGKKNLKSTRDFNPLHKEY